ncbi:hypothetical protein H6P81_012971 [Aristolochia fimbriata]|uniref:Uncharacterized protein n=1 Tax=Aristolochia fimbriata TaxID=158543 RepID=A0AAV7EDE1_ARIFI|nr:hypothetical protein H6P81_012971 [Aristolochia fimbriata]
MSMQLLQCASASSLLQPSLSSPPISLRKTCLVFPAGLFKIPSKPLFCGVRSSSNWVPNTDQDTFRVLYEADGQAPKNLPAVRTYENDLCRLTLVGAVAFEQALTAAAADGGKAADEHISSGVPNMVVETLFPGKPDEHSTIATRLFLPAKNVKEKASKLRSSLSSDMLAGTTSANILAMTFRQVVLHDLWSFELLVFSAGTERNMEDLVNPRKQILEHFILSSSDKRVLSVLAEAVCSCVLESIKEEFLKESKSLNNFFSWPETPRRIVSSDSSVCIYTMSENDKVKNAKKLVGDFNSLQWRYGHKERKQNSKVDWWLPPARSRFHKIGGTEFTVWANEHVPSYKLQFDSSNFEDVKFEGWNKLPNNRWEVLLTHMQMVELANILDMYYEDRYTVPAKRLGSGLVSDLPKVFKSKNSFGLKTLSLVFLAGGFLLVLNVLVQLFHSPSFKEKKSVVENCIVSKVDCFEYQALETAEVESLCCLLIRQVKETLGWSGNLTVEPGIGVWTGELPTYLKKMIDVPPTKEGTSYIREDTVTNMSNGDDATVAELTRSDLSPTDESNADPQTAITQDICSYQVVLSRDGTIVGFTPTSLVAVNHWAGNPLSGSLYKGRNLSPGLLEPGLKIPRPVDAVELELLMSTNSAMRFALARPVQ